MARINLLKLKKRDRTISKAQYQDVYNTLRWKRMRAAWVRDNPLCERCLELGLTRQVEEVHHIVPFDVNDAEGTGAYDWDNLMSLCNDCHSYIHMQMRRDNQK